MLIMPSYMVLCRRQFTTLSPPNLKILLILIMCEELTVLFMDLSRHLRLGTTDLPPIYHCGADTVYLLLYVDDIVLTASSTPLL